VGVVADIYYDDTIFVHCMGKSKEVELIKSKAFLGLTITDNGNGYAFIKCIQEGSVIGQYKAVSVSFNNYSLKQCR